MATTAASEVTILLGGGLDSSTLIPFYRRRGVGIRAIHFDYGQVSLAGERRAAESICEHFAVPLEMSRLGFPLSCTNGEYAGRNALLLLAAASTTTPPRSVAIGIHTGVPYYDSSVAFVADMNRLFDGYFGGRVKVEAPFAEFAKPDVYAFAVETEVPVHLTFSCERSAHEPCGKCPSCIDREKLLARP